MSGYQRRETVNAILIERLARGSTQLDAANDADVTTRTVRRRLSDPAFVAQVRRRRGELFDEATGQASVLLPEALEVLRALFLDEFASPETRLRAAKAAIDAAHTLRGEDLALRLDEIEARLSASENNQLGAEDEGSNP
jgi:hypothetical protein